MWYSDVVLSKGLVAAALLIVNCLTSLPPNTLKTGIDKRADKARSPIPVLVPKQHFHALHPIHPRLLAKLCHLHCSMSGRDL